MHDSRLIRDDGRVKLRESNVGGVMLSAKGRVLPKKRNYSEGKIEDQEVQKCLQSMCLLPPLLFWDPFLPYLQLGLPI